MKIKSLDISTPLFYVLILSIIMAFSCQLNSPEPVSEDINSIMESNNLIQEEDKAKSISPFIDEIPVMTSNIKYRPGRIVTNRIERPYIASCSSRLSSTYDAWKAFDGNDESASWSRWISAPGPMPQWLSFSFNNTRVIRCYYILPELGNVEDRHPKNFQLQGYKLTRNRNNSWVTLDTRTNVTWNKFGSGKYFYITNPGEYIAYRLYITATNRASSQISSGVVSIRQLKMF